MPPTFVILGHIVHDLMQDGSIRLGGTALYATMTVAKLGYSVGLVTRCSDDVSLDGLPPNVEVARVSSDRTTTFENVYTEHGRLQTIHALAQPLQVTDVPWEWLDAPVVLLGPVAGEVTPAFAGRFRKSLVAAAAQGWLRRWDRQGRVRPMEPGEALGALPPLGALFLSQSDWAGDWRDLEEVCSAVPILAVTMAEKGAWLRWGATWRHVAPCPATLVDPTGAGDVFAAAFLVRFFETAQPLQAAQFAACAAAISIEGEGVASLPDPGAVRARLRKDAFSL